MAAPKDNSPWGCPPGHAAGPFSSAAGDRDPLSCVRDTGHHPHGSALSSQPRNRRAGQALVGPPSNRNTQNPNSTASPAAMCHGSTRLKPGSEDDRAVTGSHGLLGPGSWRAKEGLEASPGPQFCLPEESMGPGGHDQRGHPREDRDPLQQSRSPRLALDAAVPPVSAYMAAPQLTFFLVYLLPLLPSP